MRNKVLSTSTRALATAAVFAGCAILSVGAASATTSSDQHQLVTTASDSGSTANARYSDSSDAARKASQSAPMVYGKGTALYLRNDTSRPIWVRHYEGTMIWSGAIQIGPGGSRSYTGHSASDDIELRVWDHDPTGKVVTSDYFEIDAENPIYSTPWMSVEYDSQYFGVHQNHTWHSKQNDMKSQWWGKRDPDSDKYKQFQLHLKSLWR